MKQFAAKMSVACGVVLLVSPTVTAEPSLFGYSSWTGALLSFDLSTGAATSIAPLEYSGVTGMAYDERNGILYGASYSMDVLLAIDPITGESSVIASMAFGNISGMTFDPTSGYLFAVDGAADALIRIDPLTGETTTIGSMGFAGVYGLTIDTTTGTMYATDHFVDNLLVIDMFTGQASAIAELDLVIGGLTFNPISGMLLATDTHANGDVLYSIDPLSGVATLVGDVGVPRIQGLAFVVPAPGIPAFAFVLSMGALRRKRSRNGMCL